MFDVNKILPAVKTFPRRRHLSLLPLYAVTWFNAAAQTQVDLATQSKRVDFSGAAFTRPLKSGTALPSTCSLGDMFFKTDAPAGSNVYGCSQTNTWTVESSAAGAVT